jgi:glucosamine-6-phosphate deaminase
MEIIIQPDAAAASNVAARIIAGIVRSKPEAILGLATGSTPVNMYQELIWMHREQGLDFSKVTTFNLDEYVGLGKDHPASYYRFMRENLFDHLNVPDYRIHLPDGLSPDIPAHCRQYEGAIKAAGGIDVQVLGIGTDGHVGFNEPTSSLSSRTRIKTLTQQTIQDNAPFFPDGEQIPHHVITMGVGTIMDSRACLLMAFGKKKAKAIADTVEGAISSMVPASILQMHQRAIIIVDEEAASELSKRDYFKWVYDNKPEWQQY